MRQSSQGSSATLSSGMAKNLPLHIMVGILSMIYPDTLAILNINLSAFMLTGVDSNMEIDPITIVADADFQPYIAQAWISF